MFWKKLRQAPLRRGLIVLLLPILATVTGVELWMTDHDAIDAANAAYDRSLLGAVKSIAGNMSTASGGLSVELPYRMFEYFELTASGPVYFRVATSDGLVELGSADLPAPPSVTAVGVPQFYDAHYFGESVRVAAFLAPLEQPVPQSPAQTALIQVAESTQSRQDFTRRFMVRSALRDAWVFGLTLLTVVLAVTFALGPLARLAAQVRARKPDDLTPIAHESLSADLQPLVGAVNQLMQRTRELTAKQRQFVDDASHQLRTHLTTLQVQADHARSEAEPEPLRQTLEALRSEIGRATHTTNQFLALARSDAAPLRWQTFDLAELVRDVALSLVAKARRKQLDIGIGLLEAPGRPAMAEGDRDFLHEALLNLASNAVAYTPEGGEITLTYAAGTEGWGMGVVDSGPGLSPAERERLGARFSRSSQGGGAVPGYGLGLAIARSIAERHGGRLTLEPRADGGQGLHAGLWWPRRRGTMEGQT